MAHLLSLRVPAGTVVRLVISLALALLLWGWVTTQRDPTITRAFTDVPLPPPALPESLLVVSGASEVTVDVRLEGPRSEVEDLVADDLNPRLDLSGVEGPNEYDVPVEIDVPNAARMVRIVPPRVLITVDERVNERLPLAWDQPTLDDPTRRVVQVTPRVSEVTVSGARRFVDAVVRVELRIEIGDQLDDFEATFEPIAQDSAGNPIPEVQILPDTVPVAVELDSRGRSFPVLPETSGSPADGYEVSERLANPATVLLDGSDEALDELVAVSAEPIAIEGAVDTVSGRVGLQNLPPNVQVVDPTDGTVLVVVQIRQGASLPEQALPDRPVGISGAAAGVGVGVEPAALRVVISAAPERLASVQASEVTATVSVAGLAPGTHELPLVVAVPADVRWIRTEPATVRVTIGGGTGTPTASPAPS